MFDKMLLAWLKSITHWELIEDKKKPFQGKMSYIFRFWLSLTSKKLVHVGSAAEREIYDEKYDLVYKMLILNALNCE